MPLDQLLDTVLRWPRRVVRTGLFLCEGAVATAPRGPRLGWVAENLAALAGVDVEVADAPPAGPVVLVLAEPRLLPALAVLARVPVEAVGMSIAQLTGLRRAPLVTADAPAAGAVLCTALDDIELVRAVARGLPLVPITVEEVPPRPPVEAGAAAPPGFLVVAARPATRLRVRFGAPLSLPPDAPLAPGRALHAARALETFAA